MDANAKRATDQSVLAHIEQLVAEEHKLFQQGTLGLHDQERLSKIQVELDQY